MEGIENQAHNGPELTHNRRRTIVISNLIIRPTQLAQELGVSKTTLWRWCRQGFLPRPINLGPRLVGWERAAINKWIESKKNKVST
ncbi:helix-turn-helix transcriptional regulator [Aeromonas salmonicida]|uniref:helix-turn-helix transcriptional regulator n=1 Tax=Aeromonas salmonicida TaxID=645 RepID=UPI0035B53383